MRSGWGIVKIQCRWEMGCISMCLHYFSPCNTFKEYIEHIIPKWDNDACCLSLNYMHFLPLCSWCFIFSIILYQSISLYRKFSKLPLMMTWLKIVKIALFIHGLYVNVKMVSWIANEGSLIEFIHCYHRYLLNCSRCFWTKHLRNFIWMSYDSTGWFNFNHIILSEIISIEWHLKALSSYIINPYPFHKIVFYYFDDDAQYRILNNYAILLSGRLVPNKYFVERHNNQTRKEDTTNDKSICIR